jgi:predicted MFS family arabinose efflux permease
MPGKLRRRAAEGLAFLRRDPVLRTIAGATAGANLFLMAFNAVEVVFLVRDVRVSAGLIGVLLATGGAGGLIGSLTARMLAERLGIRAAARWALAVTAPGAVLISLARHGAGVAFFAVGSPAVSFGIALAGVAFQVWRLDRCPPAMLGRVNAGSRILTAVTIPLGALVGGTLGQLLGPRYALLVMGAGYVAFGLTLLCSPFRSERISREVLSRPR